MSVLYQAAITFCCDRFQDSNKNWVEKQNPTVLLSMDDIKRCCKPQPESVPVTVMHYVHRSRTIEKECCSQHTQKWLVLAAPANAQPQDITV